jgi:hypothetical protein
MVDIQITRIDEAEELIRRVPADPNLYGTDPASGELRISSSAFNDPELKPSVDRRKMLAKLEDSKKTPTDGLVKLVTMDVRNIKTVEQFDKAGNKIPSDNPGQPFKIHPFDAIHRPVAEDPTRGTAENPAHSQIEATPELNSGRFKKLKEALARLATKNGWLISPAP